MAKTIKIIPAPSAPSFYPLFIKGIIYKIIPAPSFLWEINATGCIQAMSVTEYSYCVHGFKQW